MQNKKRLGSNPPPKRFIENMARCGRSISGCGQLCCHLIIEPPKMPWYNTPLVKWPFYCCIHIILWHRCRSADTAHSFPWHSCCHSNRLCTVLVQGQSLQVWSSVRCHVSRCLLRWPKCEGGQASSLHLPGGSSKVQGSSKIKFQCTSEFEFQSGLPLILINLTNLGLYLELQEQCRNSILHSISLVESLVTLDDCPLNIP